MNTTSISLVNRLRTPSNHQAWDRFVELYTPLLFHWAKSCGLKPHDASDLVQDVFAVLLQKMPQFIYDPQKSFRSWLQTVTLNLWRDRCRAVATRPLPGDKGRLAEVAVPDHVPELAETEYRSYLVSRALQLMQTDFEPNTWRAAWEHAVNGRPAVEVAEELGITVPAVYGAKSRVLNRLRQELDGLLG